MFCILTAALPQAAAHTNVIQFSPWAVLRTAVCSWSTTIAYFVQELSAGNNELWNNPSILSTARAQLTAADEEGLAVHAA